MLVSELIEQLQRRRENDVLIAVVLESTDDVHYLDPRSVTYDADDDVVLVHTETLLDGEPEEAS